MSTAASRPMADRVVDLRSLLHSLRADGLISADELARLESTPRTAAQAAMHPLSYLAGQSVEDARRPNKVLDIEALTVWLAEHAGQPYLRIDPLKIDASAITEVMSFAFAQRHKILAVSATRDEVVIASAEPFVHSWEANLEHVLRRPLKRVVANPDDIDRFTVEFYTLARSVSGMTRGGTSHAGGLANFEQMLELGNLKDPDANDQHIVNVVDWLFQYAFDQRASDIHIEPRREKGNVRFRIDGVMHTVYQMPMQVLTAVISRIKILGRMNIAEKRRPQDGRLKTKSPEGNEIELRLSTMPTAFGEKLVMRIFDPDVLLRTYKELGLQDADYDRWQAMVGQPNGIVLVTGPTGSGKTTTLYSTLKQLATPEVNLCTIEDPIEMIEPAFNQMQVQHNIDLDFASGVRALLRQDPDIIMVGEIRDLETAQMAVQAALTGHLVLSTLHTNDSPTAVSRLLELGVPAYLIKATLLGVMAQRLVRTLCPHCKEEAPVDADAWKQLTRPWQVPAPKKIYRPVGCLECRKTGYLGRQGVYEILLMSDSTREMVRGDTDLKALRQSAMREGMRTLRLSGAQKVANGVTTIEEVMRVAPLADSDR
ncbi:MAG TPA: ATPase, T2SS/T4P/T4SS family [Pseudomonadales bacterium]